MAELLLEENVRLSTSFIWELLKRYYQKAGVLAWKDGVVPSKITTNTFLARAYARLIAAFCADLRAAGTVFAPQRPVVILELGAGSGRFGYYCIKQLLSIMRRGALGLPPFRYVMSDMSEANIGFWRENRHLAPLVREGLLDFASFSATESRELVLLESGEVLRPEERREQLIVIGNYFFDSLPQDIYRIASGRLQQCLVDVVSSAAEEPDLYDPEMIPRLRLSYRHEEIAPDVYPQPELNRILAGYRDELGDTGLCFPIGGFRCLSALERLADRLLLVSADKGYSHAWQLLSKRPPPLVMHGSFSFSVNYHAIGQYIRSRGGLALHPSGRSGNLELGAFVDRGSERDFPQLCQAFERDIEDFSPVDLFTLKHGLAEREPALSIDQCLKLLRLSAWDPDTLYELRDPLRDQIEEASDEQQAAVAAALRRVWENFYPLESYRDLPFACGRIMQRMRRYRAAIGYYQASLDAFGADRATHNNLGTCHYRLDALEPALRCFDAALAADPNYGNAREWRMRVLAELNGAAREA